MPLRKPVLWTIVVLLAGAVIVGCGPGRRGGPAVPAPGPPGGPTPANAPCQVSSLPGEQSFTAPGTERFDVTQKELAVIQSRLVEVLCRQGLWNRGVRFGMNFNQAKTKSWVLIDPGSSGLSARRVLERLLGH